MKVECLIDGPWTYFVIEDLPERYKGRHGIADRLGFSLCLYDAPLLYAEDPPNVRDRYPDLYGALIPSNSPYAYRAYENFQRCVEDLFAQTAGKKSVPWEEALLTWLRRVKGCGLDWWLGGSAALAVRGVHVTPGDVDINVADGDEHRAQELFLDHLIQPVRPMTGWVHNSFTRAFPGARLEWCSGVLERADRPVPGDTGPEAVNRLETIIWQGYYVRVPPLDLQLAVSKARGLAERSREIELFMRQHA